ncbi:MAG TPA: GNAT family N-acetyltransferase [Pseudomonas sp.]|nr:GNAT family N-acetyltransferase [Pseudomonas sp.]
MLVRVTRPDDIAALAGIERSAAQAFLQLPGLAWLANGDALDDAVHWSCLAMGCSWVAESAQGRLSGFVCASLQNLTLHIEELSVLREAQGQGIGRQLLDQVVRAARQRAIPEVTLTTFMDVPWNSPFYARYGFTVIAEQDLGERLRSLLASEHAHGLTGRCAMRLLVG